MALATHRGLGILVGSQQGLHHPGMASYAGPDEDRASSLRTSCSNSITSIQYSLVHTINPTNPPTLPLASLSAPAASAKLALWRLPFKQAFQSCLVAALAVIVTDGDPGGRERKGVSCMHGRCSGRFRKFIDARRPRHLSSSSLPPHTHTLLQLYTATQVIWDES